MVMVTIVVEAMMLMLIILMTCRIYRVAMSYNIPMKTVNMCEMPLVPLRGRLNENTWRYGY
jgi:hypothetical protein